MGASATAGAIGTARPWAAALVTSKAAQSGNGVVDAGEGCDRGLGGACCSATCQFLPSTTQCRASAGSCDVAEFCTGSSDTCPANGFQPSTTVCRATAGPCDTAETCTGSSASCPADGFLSSTTVCRAAAGPCDAAETCTGSSAGCPAAGVLSSTTVWRAA